MRRVVPLYLLVLLPFTVAVSYGAQEALAKLQATNNDVWLLSQRSRFLGDLDLFVASDRVKIVHKRDQWQIVCTPPAWDVVVFNPRYKTMSVCPLSTWLKSGFAAVFALDPMPRGWPMTKEFDFEFKGVKATQYAYPKVYKTGKIAPLSKGRVGECITTQDIKTAPQVRQFVAALYSSPGVQGMPLEFSKFGTPQSFGLGLKYNKIEELYPILETDAIKLVPKSKVSYSIPKFPIRPRNEVVLGGRGKDVGGIVDLLGGE